MKRTVVAVTLALVMVLALAVPTFAFMYGWGHVTQETTYDMEGQIFMNKQLGHKCNTGAMLLQEIRGFGKYEKVMDSRQVKGHILVDDYNDFVTAPDAVRNLSVATFIELCTPPKYIYNDAVYNYPVHPYSMYGRYTQPGSFVGPGAVAGVLDSPHGPWYAGANYNWRDDYRLWDAVTDQVWGTYVEANPGERGMLWTEVDIAYGPYRGYGAAGPLAAVDTTDPRAAWTWEVRGGSIVPRIGSTFVGDYVDISSRAMTTGGIVDRIVDISSPWSGAVVFEEMTVTGMADIEEDLMVMNLPRGADTVRAWYDTLSGARWIR